MFHKLSRYVAHFFLKELGKNFNTDHIRAIAENKTEIIRFNAKINLKVAGVSNKNGKKVCKNIQFRFNSPTVCEVQMVLSLIITKVILVW